MTVRNWSWSRIGERSIMLEWQTANSERMAELVRLLYARPFAHFSHCVPAFQSIAIFLQDEAFSKTIPNMFDVITHVEQLLADIHPYYKRIAREIEIPVCYDFALDLLELSQTIGISQAEWMRIHTDAQYVVECVGFIPGFPYLSGLPPVLQVPRRAEPRARVPAGSVAVGGPFAGVYPLASPGGWHIVGRTPIPFFRVDEEQPAHVEVGDHVRFVAISRTQFDRLTKGDA